MSTWRLCKYVKYNLENISNFVTFTDIAYNSLSSRFSAGGVIEPDEGSLTALVLREGKSSTPFDTLKLTNFRDSFTEIFHAWAEIGNVVFLNFLHYMVRPRKGLAFKAMGWPSLALYGCDMKRNSTYYFHVKSLRFVMRGTKRIPYQNAGAPNIRGIIPLSSILAMPIMGPNVA